MPHSDRKTRQVPKQVPNKAVVAKPKEPWRLVITYEELICNEGPQGISCDECQQHCDSEFKQLVDLLEVDLRNSDVDADAFTGDLGNAFRIVSRWNDRQSALRAAGRVLAQFSRVAVTLEPATDQLRATS